VLHHLFYSFLSILLCQITCILNAQTILADVLVDSCLSRSGGYEYINNSYNTLYQSYTLKKYSKDGALLDSSYAEFYARPGTGSHSLLVTHHPDEGSTVMMGLNTKYAWLGNQTGLISIDSGKMMQNLQGGPSARCTFAPLKIAPQCRDFTLMYHGKDNNKGVDCHVLISDQQPAVLYWLNPSYQLVRMAATDASFTYTFENYKQVQGIWQAHKATIYQGQYLQKQYLYDSIAFPASLPDSIFMAPNTQASQHH